MGTTVRCVATGMIWSLHISILLIIIGLHISRQDMEL
jgi:hypothetical protein